MRPIAHAVRLGTRLRRGPKPLHPRGSVTGGVLTRIGSAVPAGVPWLDDHGRDEVLVRRSRGAGLPRALPDVGGLAIRVPVGESWADLLLASAGLGRVTRFLPVPCRDHDACHYSSLMPYRSARGPVLLAAAPLGPASLALLWATPRSTWHGFGRLDLDTAPSPDATVSFDAVLHRVPGLGTYDWARRLREPAYRAAREQSGRSPVPDGH